MKARFVNWCQAKGFDAIEPDNLDGWSNISNISQADNLAYDLAIAQLAHALPLSIGLKNLATDLSASHLPSSSAPSTGRSTSNATSTASATRTRRPAASSRGQGGLRRRVQHVAGLHAGNQSHMNAQLTDLDLVGATPAATSTRRVSRIRRPPGSSTSAPRWSRRWQR